MRARDFRDQRANAIDWLSRLRNNPVTRSRREITDVGGFIDDEGIGKISDQTAHFDVIGQADHHRKITGLHQSLELFVRVSNKRTSAIRDNQATFSESFAPCVGSAVRRNHDAGSLRNVAGSLFANSLRAQLFAHDRVVHQFTENGKGCLARERFRLDDGVADPKTDAEVFRSNDFHLLCVTKLVYKKFYFLPAFTICSNTRRYS